MIDARERDSVASLTRSIQQIDLDALSLQPQLAELDEVLGLGYVGLYSLRNTKGAWNISRWEASRGGASELERRTRAMFARQAAYPLYYDPMAPPPEQRNRVVDALAWIEASDPGSWETSRMVVEVLAPLGLARARQPRALLCDGPDLLAWFGGIHDGPVTQRQLRILGSLVAPMRKRLIAERALLEDNLTRNALDAMLDRVGAAAFLVDAQGSIRHANAAGRTLRDESPDVMTALGDAIARRDSPGPLQFELVEIRTAGLPDHWIAVLRTDPVEQRIVACVAACARRWQLTPRQRSVLDLVARGLPNATIASMLGCVERTVELHVTAIFDRAGVDSRAALVSVVLTQPVV